jgi:hypothetical protein
VLVLNSVILARLVFVQVRGGEGQITATSMAKPRCGAQLLNDTSPGRRLERSVGPKIPNFSISGDSKPISAN